MEGHYDNKDRTHNCLCDYAINGRPKENSAWHSHVHGECATQENHIQYGYHFVSRDNYYLKLLVWARFYLMQTYNLKRNGDCIIDGFDIHFSLHSTLWCWLTLGKNKEH